MNWYDVEDIIVDGTEDDVKKVRCPECNGGLEIQYNEKVNSLTIRCDKCGITEKLHRFPIPRYLSKY